MGFIYRITNKVSNKLYIGQTKQKDPQYRWNDHIRSMKYGKDGCPLLIASAKKYGVESFKFEVIIICFDNDLDKYEIEYINKYNTKAPNGYNITDGGNINNSFQNRRHTEETKQKLREITLKRYENPNELDTHRRNIQKFYDNGNSEKWQAYLKRLKSGQINRNKVLSDETKYKLSNIVTEYFQNQDNREIHTKIMTKLLGKRVYQYDNKNILIKEYESITVASKATGISRAAISSCINGRSNTSGGYIWKSITTK
jgi:group I intron endonuclease